MVIDNKGAKYNITEKYIIQILRSTIVLQSTYTMKSAAYMQIKYYEHKKINVKMSTNKVVLGTESLIVG